MAVQGEVKGLVQLQRKGEQVVADLRGQPMLDGMRMAVTWVSNAAKLEAPVDTGRLRSSITPEVGVFGNRVRGVVGSNVTYAPYMETGTGIFAGKSRYFPPPSALEVWARRHGFESGYVVALAIYRAGGVPGRHYLQKGFERNEARIKMKIGDVVTEIVRK